MMSQGGVTFQKQEGLINVGQPLNQFLCYTGWSLFLVMSQRAKFEIIVMSNWLFT